MSTHEPAQNRRESWLLLAWALLLFAACVFTYTRYNDFPYYYHPDEPGKVEQVMTGEWNFHHPMLLLTVTKVVVQVGRAPSEPQAVVEAGRWVSAIFMAMAATALSLLAFAWRGWLCAIAAGMALLWHHQFYELAHYMKEDAALVAGMSLTFLMLLACWWRPTLWRTALLGAACGLATSGKYLGIVALALALPVIWQASTERRGVRLALFAAAAVATFLALNLPLLEHLATFRQSFGREMEFVVKGQRGMTRSVPHAQYWNVFTDNTTPAMWVLLLAFLHGRWRERRTLTLPEWLIIGFPFAFALVLSFSPKSNDRYFVPATAIFTLLAAVGTVDLAQLFARGETRRRVALAGALLLVVCQLPSWTRYHTAFQHDDTAELITWLRTEVSPTATIAKDNRIYLPDPAKKKHADRMGVIPQKVLAARFAADLGTINAMRAQGIEYVAISESDYGRFFLKNLRPQKDERPDFERRKAFYRELLRSPNLVFERERGTVIYLHPGIRVYRLPPRVPSVSDAPAALWQGWGGKQNQLVAQAGRQ